MTDLSVETLKEIQKTAVEASANANILDVQISRYKYRRILANGTFLDTEIEPDALDDNLLSLDDLAVQYELYQKSQIWINRNYIYLLYNADQRHLGKANLKIEVSKVAQDLYCAEINEGITCNPTEFEKRGMLLFDLPEDFLNEIRALQWHKRKESVKKLENASSSATADELEVVLTQSHEVFRGRNFIVTTPIYNSPYETKTETIEVKLIVNAKEETITYSPKYGTMEKLYQKAFEELRDTIIENYNIDRNRIFCGNPNEKAIFNYEG
jgi:hypothetical protein